MTDDKNKQAATETKTDKKTAHPAKKKAVKKSSPWFVPLVILLLIIITAGYGIWQHFQQENENTSSAISSLSYQVDQLKRSQEYHGKEQQLQLDELAEKYNDLKRSFAAMLKSSGHLKNDWLLAEAEYLVKLANHRLIIEKDISTAIAAMETADERLREIADPALIEVRKLLLEHIQALRAIEQPDLTGMALQISALKKQIPQLALQTPDPATVQQRNKQPSKASKIDSWDQLPKAMWDDLKGLVTIRDHSQAVQPLIPPEQLYFLRQNLNLQLEQARLALLKGDNNLFHDSINTAIEWIEKHFDIEQQTTKSLLEGLKALSGKNIAPDIPDISQSYKVLQQYRVNGFVPKKSTPGQQDKTKEEKPGKPAPAPQQDKTKEEKPGKPAPTPQQDKKDKTPEPASQPAETPDKVVL